MKNKFYVVWEGRKVGIFDSWKDCRQQIEGFPGARYKGFPNFQDAKAAFEENHKMELQTNVSVESPVIPSIAVDAACSGNPGRMEYRGVSTETGEEIFKSPVFECGTNNIGEFLAIVHCLAWQKQNNLSLPIYSDSVNGQLWVRAKACKTKLTENNKNKYLFEIIKRAEKWLNDNDFRVPIYKWKTETWGEIPADFGRK